MSVVDVLRPCVLSIVEVSALGKCYMHGVHRRIRINLETRVSLNDVMFTVALEWNTKRGLWKKCIRIHEISGI